MDTIIYVKYKHIPADALLLERNNCLEYHLEVCRKKKDFQAVRLYFYEPYEPGQTEHMTARQLWAKQLSALQLPFFRAWFAHKAEKERKQLAQRIQEELLPLLDRWGDNACIYDGALPEAMGWVKGLLPVPEFGGYTERKWISRLAAYAEWEHFLVLGSTAELQTVFAELAPRAKSLLWIVPDFTYQNQAEALVEAIYQEYGLAIDLRFLPEGSSFARLRVSGKYLAEPTNVMDFTGEKYLPLLELAPGSIWLDFGAMEEKEKRILGRRMQVRYVSLKTII